MKHFLLPLLFLLTSCFDDSRSPETSLKEFVEMRMGNVVTREAILEKVTGKMRQSLENVSETDFQKFSDLRNVQKESFKIVSKSCQANKCFVTYSISYKSGPEGQVFTSDVKKIAEILLLDGKWLISDVSNIKTYHEASQPINAMEDQAQ